MRRYSSIITQALFFFLIYARIGGAQSCVFIPPPNVTVDTICARWHVCAHSFSGIKSITLINDWNGEFSEPGKVLRNVYLDPTLDPNRTNQIDFPGHDTMACFDIIVWNPFDTAYAPFFILDSNGRS